MPEIDDVLLLQRRTAPWLAAPWLSVVLMTVAAAPVVAAERSAAPGRASTVVASTDVLTPLAGPTALAPNLTPLGADGNKAPKPLREPAGAAPTVLIPVPVADKAAAPADKSAAESKNARLPATPRAKPGNDHPAWMQANSTAVPSMAPAAAKAPANAAKPAAAPAAAAAKPTVAPKPAVAAAPAAAKPVAAKTGAPTRATPVAAANAAPPVVAPASTSTAAPAAPAAAAPTASPPVVSASAAAQAPAAAAPPAAKARAAEPKKPAVVRGEPAAAQARSSGFIAMNETMTTRTWTNVRAKPTTKSRVRAVLRPGASVNVEGRFGRRGWFQISRNGRRFGYVGPMLLNARSAPPGNDPETAGDLKARWAKVNVVVRSAPTREARPVTVLRRGEKIEVNSAMLHDGWYQVLRNGKAIGFVGAYLFTTQPVKPRRS